MSAGAAIDLPGFGASISATHCSKHGSCATRLQGHGVRQIPDSGVSSVSSLKQIQHRLGSSSFARREFACCVTAIAVA